MECGLHHVRTLHGLHAVSSESYSVCGGGVSESYSSWAGPSPAMAGWGGGQS